MKQLHALKCQEFRRELLIDPRQQGADFLGHARDCPACGREHQRALEFERRLHQALVVESPQEIGARGLPARQMVESKPGTRIARPLLAAAGILLALGVALFVEHLGSDSDRVASLRGEILAHIEEDSASLLTSGEIDSNRLRPLLATFGLQQLASLGEVRYAGICDIGKRKGIHIVARGEARPVTLILLPGERIEAPVRILAVGLDGLIVPTNYGSLAVVADPREPVAPVLKRVQPAIAMGI